MRLLLRVFLWIWRRLGDLQTIEWLWNNQWVWNSAVSLAMSAAAALLGWLGHLRAWEFFSLGVGVFAVTMLGLRHFETWRYLRARRRSLPIDWLLASQARSAGGVPESPPPSGGRPEHIRRDLGRLITEGEDFERRGLSLSARSMLDRMVPQGIWDFYVIEWRNRTLGYFKDAGLDGARFTECSPTEAKTLTLEQLRCHVERLRESL